MLPIKTNMEDIEVLCSYLRTSVGWVTIDQIKNAIPSTHADNRKLEAMKFIGLIEREGNSVKLSEYGIRFASTTDETERSAILVALIRTIPLYHATLEWMHFSKKEAPTKFDIGNYWHDKHEDKLLDSKGQALTDAAIFFLRIAGASGLGDFIAAGRGRETNLKVDSPALSAYVTGEATSGHIQPKASKGVESQNQSKDLEQQANSPTVSLTTSPGVHVNVEIHIAADAKTSTIEDIFKNMRRYVLNLPPVDDEQ